MSRARRSQPLAAPLALRAERDPEWEARQEELQRQRRRILAVQARYGSQLLRHPDVSGLSPELQVRSGQLVRPLRYALQISVRQKGLPRGRAGTSRRLPRRFHGVPTDIIATRFARCLQSSREAGTYYPSVEGGCAIGREDQPEQWGTLGIVVSAAGRPMYLTNRHVAGPRGATIVQPPLPEIPVPVESWRIGVVVRCGATDNHSVDCALIEPSVLALARRPGLPLRPSLPGSATVTLGDGLLTDGDIGSARVWAWGAATLAGPAGWGTVRETLAAVKFPDGSYLIRQIKVEAGTAAPIVQPGDSGSVLFQEIRSRGRSQWAAVGLVVGAYEEELGDGVRRFGLVANHFAAVRRSLRFARFADENSQEAGGRG